jgi:hypothetical protein
MQSISPLGTATVNPAVCNHFSVHCPIQSLDWNSVSVFTTLVVPPTLVHSYREDLQAEWGELITLGFTFVSSY